MKKLLHFLFGILKKAALIYGILFLVFYYDLDGKFMYYIWEPFSVRHFGRIVRPDSLKTPYSKKDKIGEEDYSEIV